MVEGSCWPGWLGCDGSWPDESIDMPRSPLYFIRLNIKRAQILSVDAVLMVVDRSESPQLMNNSCPKDLK